jgi:four helix bundle protein
MLNAKFSVLLPSARLPSTPTSCTASVQRQSLTVGRACATVLVMSPPYDIRERTFEFSVEVVSFCRCSWGAHEVTRVLVKQLLKAATSVGANMEEADGGQTKPDFITKVATAKKEAKEAVYWLRLIAATDASLRPLVPPLLDEAKQIAAIVATIRINAEKSKYRGSALLALIILAACYWMFFV